MFDWYLMPHLNSPGLPFGTLRWFERAAAQLDFPVYALDDNSAVRVRGDRVDVVSGGRWQLLNAPGAGAERHPLVAADVLPALRAVAWSVLAAARRLLQPRG
jgi:hypothetical protein